MVSRETDRSAPPTPDPDLIDRLERTVAVMFRPLPRALARVTHAVSSLWRQTWALLSGALLGTDEGRRSAVWTGLLAVCVGTALAAYVSDASNALGWTLSILVALAWAGARLVVMRLVDPGLDSSGRNALTAAWGAGLLPYAAGITPLLYVAAWIGSLALTKYYLGRLAIPRVDPRATVLWVAGFEVAAAAAVWVSGNLAVLLPAG